ncbi:MAG TPA: hypothetical protein PKC70_18940, partial [Cellvibrionaceae bacterium]|nr:hypothetical protein [Cellvibrionaceae bacterium]
MGDFITLHTQAPRSKGGILTLIGRSFSLGHFLPQNKNGSNLAGCCRFTGVWRELNQAAALGDEAKGAQAQQNQAGG